MFFLFPRLERPAGWICARYKSLLLLLLLLFIFYFLYLFFNFDGVVKLRLFMYYSTIYSIQYIT